MANLLPPIGFNVPIVELDTGFATLYFQRLLQKLSLASSLVNNNGVIGLANIAANTILGNNTGTSAAVAALTATQVTAMLNVFTSALKGMVPPSGGGTVNFLRADGTWAIPTGAFRLVAFFFTTLPTASEVLAIYVAVDPFTIPANMAGTQVKKTSTGVNPAATFAIDVQNNGASIGTISIATTGTVTLTTVSGTAKSVVAGDVLHFVAPVTPDTAITNWAINLKGTL